MQERLNRIFRSALGYAYQHLSSMIEQLKQDKALFRNGIIIGGIISILVTTLSFLGHFRTYENRINDFLQSVSGKKAQDVVLLMITDKDYRQVFQARSPLSRKSLADVVDLLVRLEARVIALDIDLADKTPEQRYLTKSFRMAAEAGIPVVTIANLKPLEKSEKAKMGAPVPYGPERIDYTHDGFLLLQEVEPAFDSHTMQGGALFTLDHDDVFRRPYLLYMVEVRGPQPDFAAIPVPSFPLSVAAAYIGMDNRALSDALSSCGQGDIHLAGTRKSIGAIPFEKGGLVTPIFRGDYRYFNYSSDLNQLFKDYGRGKPGASTVFKDKVVLVGGVYDARDFYLTPIGKISGMEVMANITQSILDNEIITHKNFYVAFFLQILLGVFVSLVSITTSRFKAAIICLVVLIPITVSASLIAFYSACHWVDFVPTMAGVGLYNWVKRIIAFLKGSNPFS